MDFAELKPLSTHFCCVMLARLVHALDETGIVLLDFGDQKIRAIRVVADLGEIKVTHLAFVTVTRSLGSKEFSIRGRLLA